MLMLLVSVLAFAVYADAMPAASENAAQLHVKRDYMMCHYVKDASGDSVYYQFRAYAFNNGNADCEADICLSVSGADASISKWVRPIKVSAADSTYFCIDFPVRKGEELELTVLDADGNVISEPVSIEIPDIEDLQAPVYDKHLLSTIFVYDENNYKIPYTGDSILCGEILQSYSFVSGNPATDFIWPTPEKLEVDLKLTDVYGLSTMQDAESEKLLQETVESAMHSDMADYSPNVVETKNRGGHYRLRTYINAFGLDFERDIIMYDVPTLRYESSNDIKNGSDFRFKAYYNTGYPYTDEMTGRTYGSNISVTYVKPVDGQVPDTIRNFLTEHHTTKFDVETYPLLAGVDTFRCEITKPELGEYFLQFTSDFREGERDFIQAYSVNDTLRSEFGFPKNTFVQGSDTLATFHYRLNKKWPYISNWMGDSIPSVHIVASCLQHCNDMTKADSIRCDSLLTLETHADSIAARAIVDSLVRTIDLIGDSILIPVGHYMPLDIEGDFTFSVNNCVTDDSVSVDIHIKNVEESNFLRSYKIFVSSTPVGIEEVENNGRPHQDAMSSRRYNLQGLPVTDDYHGIVIERGKARISR